MCTPPVVDLPTRNALRIHELRMQLARKLELSRIVVKHDKFFQTTEEAEKLCREISELGKQIRELE